MVQTLSLVYTRLHGIPLGRADRPFVGWYGDMEMRAHAWRLLQSGPLDVRIRIGPPVPLARYSAVAGIPLPDLVKMGWITEKRLESVVQRTRDGGAEIVKLLQTGSAFYAPAASAVQMAEAILKDKKRLLPACAYLNGEYGFRDLYLGVPVILGSRGLEKIVELDLTAEEKAALAKSAEDVKKGIADLELEPAAR